MAQFNSSEASAVLREFVTSWCLQFDVSSSLSQSEQFAEFVSKIAGEAALRASVSRMTGRATYLGSSLACSCGSRARFVGYRKRWIKSACGEVVVERAYYHCRECSKGEFPWDEAQGLTSKAGTPRWKATVCHVMGHVPYAAGVDLLERLCCVRIEESTAEDIVLEVGVRVRAQEEQRVEAVKLGLENQTKDRLMLDDACAGAAPAIERRQVKGKRLYLGVDAATANIDKEWHNVQHGIAFTVNQDENGQDVLSEREYVAGQMDMPTLGWRMRALAESWDQRSYSETVFLADGAPSNWGIAATHFPTAIMILDFYHASQHVADLAKALYRQDDPTQKALSERWLAQRLSSLKHDGPGPLLRALKRRHCRKPEQREALRRELHYFTSNRDRMNYPAHVAAGRAIGSGPIEAACKSITGLRLKGTGMRWTARGADAILALRTTILNGRTDEFEHLARAA